MNHGRPLCGKLGTRFRLSFLLPLILNLMLQACTAPDPGPQIMPQVASQAPKTGAAILHIGAPEDDYLFDPQDPGRVTVGVGVVNTNNLIPSLEWMPVFNSSLCWQSLGST